MGRRVVAESSLRPNVYGSSLALSDAYHNHISSGSCLLGYRMVLFIDDCLSLGRINVVAGLICIASRAALCLKKHHRYLNDSPVCL